MDGGTWIEQNAWLIDEDRSFPGMKDLQCAPAQYMQMTGCFGLVILELPQSWPE
jgi:hypothetical protein